MAQWGHGPKVVLGIHGITASSMSLAPVGRRLGRGHRMVAPDLRGRGDSNRLPGPWGFVSHATDCARVVEEMAGHPVVVVGESMGAYVAVVLGATHPDLVERLVLVDGGLPATPPPQVDPATVLEAVLGPALARLRQTFPNRQAYLDFWRPHPALGEDWNADVEAYLAYDLEEADGGWRSKVSEEAVTSDGAEALADPALIETCLGQLRCPVHLLRAPRNLLNQPVPVISEEAVAKWSGELRMEEELVDDTNHYTVMFGARGSKTIAERAR